MPTSSTKAVAASEDDAILAVLERLALEAGRVIGALFRAGCAVERKADASPVTEADHAAERIILAGLREAFPDIACVAEEEIAAGGMPISLPPVFFLVDPLDGTREFIGGKTDFTVNIALVRQEQPELGVVFAPLRGCLYAGRPGRAERAEVDGATAAVVSRRQIAARQATLPMTVVASRSHGNAETETFIRALAAAEIVSIGSSLKFCLIAEGEADIYPRFSRTMEWDTAAGDAVLRAAGGSTRTLDGAPLAYGKCRAADPFANPSFVARGRPEA